MVILQQNSVCEDLLDFDEMIRTFWKISFSKMTFIVSSKKTGTLVSSGPRAAIFSFSSSPPPPLPALLPPVHVGPPFFLKYIFLKYTILSLILKSIKLHIYRVMGDVSSLGFFF